MAQDMGLGILGGENVIFKRKFRWTFTVISPNEFKTSPNFVKIAARPKLTVEEKDIHYLNGWMSIPGKGKWETMAVSYYDTNSSGTNNLFSWLASVYDFTGAASNNSNGNTQKNLRQASKPIDYAATCLLEMFDGCGNSMEKWTLERTWPQSIDFGELDYSSSEEVVIALTLRYAFVTLVRTCPNTPITPKCGDCTAVQ
jgi:hypothetical protein